VCCLAAWIEPAAAQTPIDALICKPGKTVAASVYGLWMGSGGDSGMGDDPTVVQYPNLVTNIGGAWDDQNTKEIFTAPCTGTYTVSITFVRDSVSTTSNCGSTAGTSDDVYIEPWRKPVGGGDAKRIGNEKGAWAGQADISRSTGAYTVSARLDAGDQIYTLVLSDSGRFRCLASVNLDIHKIGR
jgi:hypothetical protein